jgi:diguanylate cyclase (GGDEF)-like protein/PAS domain S-box-containing protein
MPAHRPRDPWLRRRGYALRLAQCFCFEALATFYVGSAPEDNLIWVANGVLLAYLLLAPRKRWPGYLAAAFLAQIAADALVDPHWQANLMLVLLNFVEVLIGALLMRRRSNDFPQFTDRGYLIRFGVYAVLLGPLVAGFLYSLVFTFLLHSAPDHAFIRWVVADALGICVTTPACVAIFRARLRRTLLRQKHWKLLALLAVVTLTAFMQTQVPLLFIIYPLLILILLRQGLGSASLATIYVAGVGSWFTIREQGPFVISRSLTPFEPSILLQIFIASAIFMLYSVSVILESEQTARRKLQKIAALHSLVTENSRDIIIVADFDGRFNYVSPAVHSVGGWTPEELIHLGSLDLIHPEDRPSVGTIVNELRSEGDAARLECRAQKQDGDFIWVEAVLRVIRDPTTRVPTGILITIRDISERKQTERRLQDAYATVEALSVTDALTGLANRRQFDQCLSTEWRRSTRDKKPLSLLMVDVDFFKLYNDTNGHLRGDTCLKQIADAISEVATRPGDLTARFGGEEFAIILPRTPNEGAVLVAHKICDTIRSRRLPHSATPGGFITVSAGCATIIPELELHSSDLIDMADEALYAAKRGGRDCVCNGTALTGREESGPANATMP